MNIGKHLVINRWKIGKKERESHMVNAYRKLVRKGALVR